MKLAPIYDKVEKHIVDLVPPKNLYDYTIALKKSGKCKDLSVRTCFDLLHAVYPPHTICEWYDTYNCDDTHIFTLIKSIVKKNYPNTYDLFND